MQHAVILQHGESIYNKQAPSKQIDVNIELCGAVAAACEAADAYCDDVAAECDAVSAYCGAVAADCGCVGLLRCCAC